MHSLSSSPARLLVVGALHVDEIARSATPLVPRASNPVSWQRLAGGVASNAALSARAVTDTGTRIQLCAATGVDTAATQLAQTIEHSGVEALLQRIPGATTGRYTAIMDSDGELHIGLSDAALAERLSADQVPLHADDASCRALLLDANLSQECLQTLVCRAGERGIPVAAMSVAPAKARRLLPIAERLDLLFVNRREAIAMVDPRLPADVALDTLADGLLEQGFSTQVITDGSQPVLIQQDGTRHQLPVPSTSRCRSVNGAGDALAGASFASWSSGISLLEAVRDVGLLQSARVVSGEHLQPSCLMPVMQGL